MKNRVDRLNSQIQEQIAAIFEFSLSDPRLERVTVTRVDLSRDFSHAKVYLALPEVEKSHKGVFQALDKASGFIRRKLSDVLHIRVLPELHFLEDKSIDYSLKMEKLLEKIHEQESSSPSPGTSDSDPES